MEMIPEEASTKGGEGGGGISEGGGGISDSDADLSISSDEPEPNPNAIVEFVSGSSLVGYATGILSRGSSASRGSSVGSKKHRPVKAANKSVQKVKRPRKVKLLTEAEKKAARDQLTSMPSDASVESQPTKRSRKGSNADDEWIEGIKAGLAKDTQAALSGLEAVLN